MPTVQKHKHNLENPTPLDNINYKERRYQKKKQAIPSDWKA